MTIRDPEVLDALRDEPELLAIADAVTETQPRPRVSHRRALSRSAGVVLVGAAALVAVLLWPSGGGRNPILDRALAAIGKGPVLHLVVQVPSGQELVDLRTARTIVPTFGIESWSDRNLKHFHWIFRQNGRIVAELLYPQDRDTNLHIGKIDPSYRALWTGFRQALDNRKAKIVGKGSVYGHPVYWLRFSSPRNEVAVDRRTYKVVAFRSISESGRHFDQRVLLARTEPLSASAFRRLTSRPNPLSGVTSHSSGVQVAPVRPSRPGKPWLRAGSTIAGLKLASVHQTQTTTDGKTTSGFELVYGSESGFRRSVTIDEAKHPDDPAEWKGIPRGFVRLTAGEGSEGNTPTYTIWTAYLIRHGVYVSITTAVSRAAVLEAARALRPA
jgi:hypothetical protein